MWCIYFQRSEGDVVICLQSSLARAFAHIIPPLAQVRRDGADISLPSDELVPGDIVLINKGNQSPADVRLLTITGGFAVDQSFLNASDVESVAKNSAVSDKITDGKEGAPSNLMLVGMMATKGTATGVVMSTGRNTIIGLKCDAEGLFEEANTCCVIA
ncbi:hypothetical protein AAMO2058_001088200 [Amorphochlora amoebiformis]